MLAPDQLFFHGDFMVSGGRNIRTVALSFVMLEVNLRANFGYFGVSFINGQQRPLFTILEEF